MLPHGFRLSAVYKHVMKRHLKNVKKTTRTAPAASNTEQKPDQPNVPAADDADESETWDEKMSRWERLVLHDVDSNDFWVDVHVGDLVRMPVIHLANFLQQQIKILPDVRKEVFMEDCPFTSVQHLVYGKAADIAVDFETLSGDTAAASEHLWAPMWDHVPDDNRTAVRAYCVCLLNEIAADYNMRIMLLVTELPLTLCWLVYRPFGEPCPERKRIAATLLDLLKQSNMDESFLIKNKHLQTPWKIVTRFAAELTVAYLEGTITRGLHFFLVCVVRQLSSDTQEIEGINSIIKHIKDVAPSIGLFLLNARTINKKTLDLSSGDPEQVVRALVLNHDQGLSVLKDIKRRENLKWSRYDEEES